ncbi:hypothetical protein HJC99_00170 [Candidatus Saccharibacteria bacterium]|nr:hypothetical protein [Candidatus Saccharibacteria bacterium]
MSAAVKDGFVVPKPGSPLPPANARPLALVPLPGHLTDSLAARASSRTDRPSSSKTKPKKPPTSAYKAAPPADATSDVSDDLPAKAVSAAPSAEKQVVVDDQLVANEEAPATQVLVAVDQSSSDAARQARMNKWADFASEVVGLFEDPITTVHLDASNQPLYLVLMLAGRDSAHPVENVDLYGKDPNEVANVWRGLLGAGYHVNLKSSLPGVHS